MAGRSPGSDTANPPEASSTSVSVSRRRLASEATRWRASFRNRKPDCRSDGETTTARPPCSTVQAALSAATVLLPLCRVALSSSRGDGESSTSRCPGIEGQLGDALGPGDGIVERGGLRWCQCCERAAEQGQLTLECGGAHASVACTRAIA